LLTSHILWILLVLHVFTFLHLKRTHCRRACGIIFEDKSLGFIQDLLLKRNAIRKDGIVGWLGIMHTSLAKFNSGGKAYGQQLQEARDKANAKKMDEQGYIDALADVFRNKVLIAMLEAEMDELDDDDVGGLSSAFARMLP